MENHLQSKKHKDNQKKFKQDIQLDDNLEEWNTNLINS